MPVFLSTFSFRVNSIYLFSFAVLGLNCCTRPSLVVAGGGYTWLWWEGVSAQWLLLLWSTVSRFTGSVVVAHWLNCCEACGVL